MQHEPKTLLIFKGNQEACRNATPTIMAHATSIRNKQQETLPIGKFSRTIEAVDADYVCNYHHGITELIITSPSELLAQKKEEIEEEEQFIQNIAVFVFMSIEKTGSRVFGNHILQGDNGYNAWHYDNSNMVLVGGVWNIENQELMDIQSKVLTSSEYREMYCAIDAFPIIQACSDSSQWLGELDIPGTLNHFKELLPDLLIEGEPLLSPLSTVRHNIVDASDPENEDLWFPYCYIETEGLFIEYMPAQSDVFSGLGSVILKPITGFGIDTPSTSPPYGALYADSYGHNVSLFYQRDGYFNGIYDGFTPEIETGYGTAYGNRNESVGMPVLLSVYDDVDQVQWGMSPRMRSYRDDWENPTYSEVFGLFVGSSGVYNRNVFLWQSRFGPMFNGRILEDDNWTVGDLGYLAIQTGPLFSDYDPAHATSIMAIKSWELDGIGFDATTVMGNNIIPSGTYPALTDSGDCNSFINFKGFCERKSTSTWQEMSNSATFEAAMHQIIKTGYETGGATVHVQTNLITPENPIEDPLVELHPNVFLGFSGEEYNAEFTEWPGATIADRGLRRILIYCAPFGKQGE